MKTTTMLMMSALSAFVAGAGGENGAKPVSFEYFVSPVGTTNAAFTAAEPGAWDSLPAALKTAREKCKKDKTPIAGETVVFALGEYKGLSLALSGAGENIPFILKGADGKAKNVIFDGTDAKGRAFTFSVSFTRAAVLDITFRNYSSTNESAVVALAGNTDKRTSVAFSNCVFRANRTTARGGVGGLGCAFVGCLFEDNVAGTSAATILGRQWGDPRTRAENCVFRGNAAPDYELTYDTYNENGNADNTTFGAHIVMKDCTVESWSRGAPGRTDGKAGVDSVVTKPGDDLVALRDRLRAGRTPGKRAEIVLEDGVYTLEKPLLLDGRDLNLTVRAKNRNKAVFVGGWNFRGRDLKQLADAALLKRLPEAVRGKVVAIAVPERVATNLVGFSKGGCGEKPILSVDGAWMAPASWPNGQRGWMWMTKTNMVNTVAHPKLDAKGAPVLGADKTPLMSTNCVIATLTGREAKWDTSAADIWIFGFQGGCDYATGCTRIAGYLPEKGGIEVDGMSSIWWGNTQRFRFMNVFEELDEPGEWCYDRKTKTLVLYPLAGFNADSLVALGTKKDAFFDIRGDSIRLEGLTFTAKRGGVCVAIGYGRENEVAGCRFTAVNLGVNLRGHRNGVLSCDFIGVQGNCISGRSGKPRNLEYGELYAENCLCENFGNFREGFANGAIRMDGCGNNIRHCDVHGSLEHGIDMYGCNDGVMEYCRIYDVSREFGDSGAVYMSGVNSYGAVLRYNDIGSAPGMSNGIYLDDFCSGVTIYGNIVRNVGFFGIFLGGGRDLTVENNVVTASWGGLRTDNRGLFWPAWAQKEKCWGSWCDMFGLTNNSPFAAKHPRFTKWWENSGAELLTAPIDNVFRHNVMIDLPGYSSSIFVALKKDFPQERVIFENNLAVRTRGLRPGCSDLAGGDAAKAPTNEHTKAMTSSTFRALGPDIKILDGTPENPVDLGFVKMPKATFDATEYMWEAQGWIDPARLRKMREEGRCVDAADLSGDFTLKPGARLLDELPGFKPIPFKKIGLYRDRYRTDPSLQEKPEPDDGKPWWKLW